MMRTMKSLLLSLIFTFIGIACLAQNVSDVVASQDGNNVVVSYYIDKASPSVQLTVSTDGGRTFSSPLKKVSGDLKNVTPGYHRIVWDVLSEFEKLTGDNIVFNVTTAGSGSGMINGYEYVDLGLSVKWATCNIGATKPEKYGRYFAWGDVTGQTWYGSSWSGSGFSKYPSYALDAKKNLKLEYDAAHVNLGGTWRMPTKAEFEELINNCTCTWTSNYNSTGVAGRIFTSKKRGYTDKSIFLPAAGFGNYSSLYHAGSYGHYWSSSFYNDNGAWNLDFYSGNVDTYYYCRYYGRSVRPVTE